MLSWRITAEISWPKQLCKKEQMRIHPPFDLKPKTDLRGTLGKNLLVKDRLVRFVYKFVKSVTKTSSKVQESKIYDKATHNLIYRNRWQEVIDKKL